MEQRTIEWHSARLGKLTASAIADILPGKRGGYLEARRKLMLKLVAERWTNQVAQNYTTPAMQWGIDQEPVARALYEAHTGQFVTEVGFIDHPTIDMSGASPDGLVGEGLLEIKCPTVETHVSYLLDGVVPEQYKPQMAWQCACTGRGWVDFCSFHPALPASKQLFVIQYVPDGDYLAMLRMAE